MDLTFRRRTRTVHLEAFPPQALEQELGQDAPGRVARAEEEHFEGRWKSHGASRRTT